LPSGPTAFISPDKGQGSGPNAVLSFVDYVASLTPSRVPPGGIDLNPAFRVGLTGTYHANADCTGTAEFDFPAPPGLSSGQVIKLMFVLAAHGREIHAVVASLVSAAQEKRDPD
jgi:hypothetical protein